MPLPDINSRPVTQNPGFVADTGAAEGAASLFSNLANEARGFRRRLQPVLNAQAEEQAAQDVLEAARNREDGNRAVEVPAKRALSQQAGVYNQVVTTGIMANAKADYAEQVQALRAKHQFDPEGFEEASEQFLSKYSENLDVSGDLLMSLELEGRAMFGAEGARITEQVRARQVQETQDSLQRRLGQVQAEMTTLLENDGAVATFADEYKGLEAEAVDLVTILADNPVYGWSDEQAAEALDGIGNQAQEVVSIQQMQATFYKDGAAAALGYIDEAINAMTLDQQERIGARSRMQSELSMLMQLDNIEEKERKDAHDERVEELEAAALGFEADLLQRMSQREKPTDADMTSMNMLVRAGALTPARMNTYVNAMLADESTPNDEAFVATLFDVARDPDFSRDDLENLTIDAIGGGFIDASVRETILRANAQANDDRFKAGQNVIDGMFATGFMDIDTAAVKSQKAMAESELRAFFDARPEATASDLEQKAKQLAVEYGRRTPAPPTPSIPGAPAAGFIDPQNIGPWAEQMRISALDAYEAGNYSPEEFTDAMNKIDDREAWQRSQMRLQQESVSAPSE